MTKSFSFTRRFRVLLLAATVFTLLLQASGVAALDCQVEDRYGELRNCTFTEELGLCFLDSTDSWEQCLEDVTGFWETVGCDAALLLDMAACTAGIPFQWLLL